MSVIKNCLLGRICQLPAAEKNNFLQKFIFVRLLFLTSLCLSVVINAQSDFVSFPDRAEFTAVSNNLSTINFDTVAPAKSFG
jgi:hypothetical protein